MPWTRDQRNAYDRARYKNNPRRRQNVIDRAKWDRIERNFGLTREQWQTIFDRQGGVCACCRRPLPDGFRACVDHDHVTGEIRGIICFDCNTSIGKLGDDAAGLTRALVYVSGATAPAELIDEHW